MKQETWTNWAGNLHCSAEVCAPRCLDDLRKAVRQAAESGRRVRVAGGSYSWAPLVPSQDLILRLDGLDRVLHIDEDARTVEVECGVSVEQLTAFAAKHKLTVLTPTLYPKPTLGGAVAVGAHGTDFAHGGIQDAVVAMKIVDAKGDLKVLTVDDDDMAAAKVALGTLGVMYSITIQLVPQFDVATQIRILPVERVLDEFDDLQASCDFLEMFWFPFSKTMAVYVMDRTTAPPDPSTWWTRLKRDASTQFQDVASQQLIPWIAKNAPQLTPILNTVSAKVGFRPGFNVETASEAFHFQRAYAKCWEMEYGVPASQAARAWRDGIELVQHYASAGLYPINLTLHGRFTGASASWLAPNHGRPTCYIDLTTAMGTPYWESFFRELEQTWCQIEGARPHWGKMYFATERLSAQYEMMDRFLEVRERWDPKGLFLNEFLEEEVFQLSSRAPATVRPEEAAQRPAAGWSVTSPA